jgi:GNAT superfamily N-acetyltransferase
MELNLREMNTEEAKAVQALGNKVFLRSLEGPYVPRPSTAKVALLDGKIVGAFCYSFELCGEKKLGFVDYLFVDSAHAGQGIGRALCQAGTDHLWEQGCDYLATIVRDDNVGSWSGFLKQGFIRADLPKVVGALGVGGFIKTYLKHFFGFSPGCDFYFATRPENISPPLSTFAKKTGFGQITLHIITNMILVLLPVFIGVMTSAIAPSNIPMLVLRLLIVFGGVILFGYIPTLFSGRKWHYRMPNGGLLLTSILSLFGFFMPMAGNWYPDHYENTPAFRKHMGISAFLPWLFLLGISIAARLHNGLFSFFDTRVLAIIGVLLIFRCIPSPVVNLGSVRVFRWNKALCILLALLSVFTVFFWPA